MSTKTAPGTVFCIVERANDVWRLELWKPGTPRGRMTHEGNCDQLLRIASEMVTAEQEVRIIPMSAEDWYGPTERWSGAPDAVPGQERTRR